MWVKHRAKQPNRPSNICRAPSYLLTVLSREETMERQGESSFCTAGSQTSPLVPVQRPQASTSSIPEQRNWGICSPQHQQIYLLFQPPQTFTNLPAHSSAQPRLSTLQPLVSPEDDLKVRKRHTEHSCLFCSSSGSVPCTTSTALNIFLGNQTSNPNKTLPRAQPVTWARAHQQVTHPG